MKKNEIVAFIKKYQQRHQSLSNRVIDLLVMFIESIKFKNYKDDQDVNFFKDFIASLDKGDQKSLITYLQNSQNHKEIGEEFLAWYFENKEHNKTIVPSIIWGEIIKHLDVKSLYKLSQTASFFKPITYKLKKIKNEIYLKPTSIIKFPLPENDKFNLGRNAVEIDLNKILFIRHKMNFKNDLELLTINGATYDHKVIMKEFPLYSLHKLSEKTIIGICKNTLKTFDFNSSFNKKFTTVFDIANETKDKKIIAFERNDKGAIAIITGNHPKKIGSDKKFTLFILDDKYKIKYQKKLNYPPHDMSLLNEKEILISIKKSGERKVYLHNLENNKEQEIINLSANTLKKDISIYTTGLFNEQSFAVLIAYEYKSSEIQFWQKNKDGYQLSKTIKDENLGLCYPILALSENLIATRGINEETANILLIWDIEKGRCVQSIPIPANSEFECMNEILLLANKGLVLLAKDGAVYMPTFEELNATSKDEPILDLANYSCGPK